MFGRKTANGLLVLALLVGAAGCTKEADNDFKTQEAGKTVKPPKVAHVHGPHDGHMAELGDKMMAEITFQADPRQIAVYVVDHEDPSKAVAIEAQSMTLELHGGSSPLTLSAERQEGDEEGKASKFVVAGEAIPASIKSIEDIEGDLKVDVAGKTLEAEFGDHDHEGHDHKDHEHDE